jgi:hypothetical protein
MSEMILNSEPSTTPGHQRPSKQRDQNAVPRLLLILFLFSGVSGLMLEIVWSRMLGWLLGATTWSVMTVLVAFMGPVSRWP